MSVISGAGTASLVGLLSGGKGKDGLFGKHGKDGIFGKHGIFGKDGIFGKHGKGKKRSLMSVEERQDLNTLLRKGERRKRERCRNRREHT